MRSDQSSDHSLYVSVCNLCITVNNKAHGNRVYLKYKQSRINSLMQTNNNLKPMFNGSVLMNETAIHDQAVMNVLKSCSQNNFEFKGTWRGESYNISDRD